MNSISTFKGLDEQALELFARKGMEDPSVVVSQAGNGNAVKVRRVLQMVSDLSRKPISELRVLDVGCGEGVYAVETAIAGANVLAVDARSERMDQGAAAAKRSGLTNVRFELGDVRKLTRASYGQFDVIYFLGILYHLDVPDIFHVLANLHDMCQRLLVIDTHIWTRPSETEISYQNRTYRGYKVREHGETDTEALKRSRLLASIDNPFSFYFTKDSLIRLLTATGFTSVLECHAPIEPGKPEDRISLIAIKSDLVRIQSYPWINGMTEAQVEEALQRSAGPRLETQTGHPAKRLIKASLRKLGFEIRRVQR